MLLGVPCCDIDVATDMRPQELVECFPGSLTVGISFGVVVVTRKGMKIEVATFRTDEGYSDGRHPDGIRFATAREDAARRDFTVNAMFYDPVEEKVIDYVGGRRDLQARLIRTVGFPPDRFKEDFLRMLRAVRFATVLNFEIEAKTMEAVRALSHEIARVSGERIREELSRIFSSRYRKRGILLLKESGLMAHLLPEVTALEGVEQSPLLHPEGDAFEHTVKAVELLHPDADFATVLAVLLHDTGKRPALEESGSFHKHEHYGAELAEKVCRRLRLDKKTSEKIVWAVKHHQVFREARKMRDSTLRRILAHPAADMLMELWRVDLESSRRKMDDYEYVRRKIDEFEKEQMLPPPLLDGHDVMALGVPSGPMVGKILREVRDAQLDGKVGSKEEALAMARQMLGARGE